MKTSRFYYADAVQHVYQRAKDHGVIFYSLEDRIVYYTLAAVKSKKFEVTVLAAAVMYTHLHQSLKTSRLASLRKYLNSLNSTFARLYNRHYRRENSFFDWNPGRAQKSSPKSKRSNIIYVFNNHEEKHLCNKAIEERWSLLAYAKSDHPFSKVINFKHASEPFLKAIRLVDKRLEKATYLSYKDLSKVFPYLNNTEIEQFTDYVISRYQLIDYAAAAELFGGIGNMIASIGNTTGSEFDLKEDFNSLTDQAYVELVEYADKEGLAYKIYRLEPDEKTEWASRAKIATSATLHHLCKFFHISYLGYA